MLILDISSNYGEIIKKLSKLNKQLDVHVPIICTPEQLMGGE